MKKEERDLTMILVMRTISEQLAKIVKELEGINQQLGMISSTRSNGRTY